MIKCAKEPRCLITSNILLSCAIKWYVIDYAFTENVRDIGAWLGAGWITKREEKELHDYNLKLFRKYYAAEN